MCSAAKHISLGQLGEDMASKHLQLVGYRILSRNQRERGGEIDILARDRLGTLVFVEVKTLRDAPGGLMPEDDLTKAKLRKLRRTAELYANKHPELIRETKGWRIDLVAISVSGDERPEISHYENIHP